MTLLLFAFVLVGQHWVQATDAFYPAACGGTYPHHLQGIRTDGKDSVSWCWTDKLVKTDCGIAPIRGGRFLVAHNTAIKDDEGKTKVNLARIVIARPEEKTEMEIETPCSH